MNANSVRRGALWTGLCLLTVWSIYGIVHEKLLQQDIWTHVGLRRFLIFAASYVLLFAVFGFLSPGRFPVVVAVAAAVLAMVSAGPVAFLTVAFILLSSFTLGHSILGRGFPEDSATDGMLATLLGFATYIFFLSLAAHVKINYSWTYLVALALPLLWNWRTAAQCLAKIPALLRPLYLNRHEQFAGAALIFVLAVHLLVALQPEVGPDALAMHLAIPNSVAWSHQWSFDVNQHLWAVMPMGGDWAFTLCYLLGGEGAARLFNFTLLLGVVGLLFCAIRKWLPLTQSLFLVAIFAATPLVQLVTGSLFVENQWALLCLGALLSLDQYREQDDSRYLYLAYVLLGAAAATKFGALALSLPLILVTGWILWNKPGASARLRQTLIAFLCFTLFAAPPYVSALAKTGNPVFPYLAKFFPSRYPDLAAGVGTPPAGPHLALSTPYDVVFHTSLFYEVQDGATGFQYFFFLPLGVLLLRRKVPALAIESAVAFGLFGIVTLTIQPDVRYLYPALAPATLCIAAIFASLAQTDRTLYRVITVVAVAVFFLDLYFLPSSGWMHKEFAVNPISSRARADYLAAYAPERNLIADLNRSHPGARIAFFESNAIAGLKAPAFTTSWHTPGFNNRVSLATSAADCLGILREYGIQFVIAPHVDSGIRITTTPEETFLKLCTQPEFTSGKFYAGRVKATCDDPADTATATPGEYDDLDPRIGFQGLWSRGRFPQASNGTLTWSDAAGAKALLRFNGSEVTYVYTKAFNRGIAEVVIDGVSKGTVDLYSPAIDWKTAARFLAGNYGPHTLEIRVTGRKTASASGSFVDLDELIVR